MGCGCNKNQVKSIPQLNVQQKKVVNVVSSNLRKCIKCSSNMTYKQQFVAKLRGYIKIWECQNKSCNFKIVGP
jgi:ABC-type branched-subunit amino acid transport system substrate-binding protein